MNYFEHRYYRVNKILMSIIGLWPYQNARVSLGCQILTSVVVVGYAIPQATTIIKYRDDWEILLECFISWIFFTEGCVKFYCSRLKVKKMMALLDSIRTSWKVWAREQEVNILHKYDEQGRKITILYVVFLYSTGMLFATQPIMSKIIDVLLKNGSKPGQFPYPVNYYFFDEQKYYFLVFMHCLVNVSLGFIVSIAIGTMFIVHVLHGCGIFAALGQKLERIATHERIAQTRESAYQLNKMDVELEDIAWCIDRHNDAIQYAELIESTYSLCFFLVLGCKMLIISITGFQVVNGSMDSQETTKFIVCNIATMVHLYIESYLSNVLMDHSISIRHRIHNSEWYKLTLKTQKAINLIIVRCNVACKLTAGKLFIMSVETFTTIVKTSISCLTVLRSRNV